MSSFAHLSLQWNLLPVLRGLIKDDDAATALRVFYQSDLRIQKGDDYGPSGTKGFPEQQQKDEEPNEWLQR